MADADDAPFSIDLPPLVLRALTATQASSSEALTTVLTEIADGPIPTSCQKPDRIPVTGPTDAALLERAQHAAREQGMDLADAIESVLRHRPVLLTAAELTRLLGLPQISTLTRPLENDPDAPQVAGHTPTGKHLYDAHAVSSWWPSRRRAKGRQQQPDEVRRRAVELVTQDHLSYAATARRLGVNAKSVGAWVAKHHAAQSDHQD